MKTPSPRELRERAAAHGQEHVFAFFDALGETERSVLLDQLARVDFERVSEQARLLSEGSAGEPDEEEGLVPAQVFLLRRSAAEERLAAEAVARGEELLAAGAVAPLLVAGGQGSRLGFEGPKGAYPVGPVSGRTLFELHARSLRAAERRHGRALPWFVMTSPLNDRVTRTFFDAQGFFGLDRDQVTFVPQAMQPALDREGRIVMATRSSLFLAPDGHGGVFDALSLGGAFEVARDQGVECLSYVQVDNPLARALDPLFIGLHTLAGARMSSKVLKKRDASEGLGVIGVSGGQTRCIEYSDLSDDKREARGADGELVWGMGGIAMHLVDLELAEELTGSEAALPWHVARKTIRGIDRSGAEVSLEGVKFERFVFDALTLSPRSVTLEVAREEQFSPLKNREGLDSPESVRRDLCRLHASWVKEAGLELPPPPADGGPPAVEVDPLLAESGAELRARGVVIPQRRETGWLYD